MPDPVLINELANIPHSEGQTVLHALRDDFEVRVTFSGRKYWIHGYVRDKGHTNLMAERSTPREARQAGLQFVEGRPGL